MRRDVRQSVPARLVALCFIVAILLGNIWLAHALVGSTGPSWLMPALEASGGVTVIMMLIFAINTFRLYWTVPDPDIAQEDSSLDKDEKGQRS